MIANLGDTPTAPPAPRDLGMATNPRSPPLEHTRWTARFAMRSATWMVLLSVTVFERFGITSGKNAIDFSLIVLYMLVFLGLVFDAFELSIMRLVLFAALTASACLSYGFNLALGDNLSIASMLLFIVLYAPFVISLRGPFVDATGEVAASQFLAIALLLAAAGTLQFFLQFAIHASWLFDYTPLIPEVFRGPTNFNTVYSVGHFTKSNGFFLREPSEFSLLMGLAIVIESSWKRRPWALVCFGTGLILSYSGTGILTLGVGLLVPFNYKVALRLLLVALLGAAVYFAAGEALRLDITLRRVSEFGAAGSSGYARYIAPAFLVQDTFNDTAWSPILGHGPGMITKAAGRYQSHDPTWAKGIFEYGLLGFLLVCALMTSVLRKPQIPLRLTVVLMVTWLVTGGHLLSASAAALRLILVGFLPSLSEAALGLDRRQPGPPTLGYRDHAGEAAR